MSDPNFVDSIAQLFLNPTAPSAGSLINPSISDERRRKLTRNALHAFPTLAREYSMRDYTAFSDQHKDCVTMNKQLKKLNGGLIDANRTLQNAHKVLAQHHDELHRLYDELTRDYTDLAEEYTQLLADRERLEEKYAGALLETGKAGE
ncbi:hypothetical protein B0H19DRAFT_1333023 [Mycena capillaripes]|nr:hypothetical protein B0H19DRAFT_1333023 [Mycena capillaripes]